MVLLYWFEIEGGLTGDKFTSTLVHFITTQILPFKNNTMKIIFYSDSCNYQNRNVILSNNLLPIAGKYKIEIE